MFLSNVFFIQFDFVVLQYRYYARPAISGNPVLTPEGYRATVTYLVVYWRISL